MGLLDFLFKTEAHRKLAELLWTGGLTASVHEFSLLSGLPYATTYELLHKMLSMGLVQKAQKGRATLFSSKLSSEQMNVFKALMGKTDVGEEKSLTEFSEMDLPLVGDFSELRNEKAKNVDELLVKTVLLAKKDSTLLRVLPLLVNRLGAKLNEQQLGYWSKQYHVDREVGFALDLTAKLSGEKRYSTLAKKLKDKRWSKPSFFLKSEEGLSGFRAKLVDENTPELAKKWFLKMNVGLDSFESIFAKYAGRTA